jgi:hypothetical protein
MATLEQIRLEQLLRPFEGPGGLASLNPLAFQYQDQLYPQSNNTMAKNIMSNFQDQLYPQSEEMRDAQILMNQPDTVFTNSIQDPAFGIKNLAGYNYDPYLGYKDDFNYNYNLGTRPSFLGTNTPLDMNRFQGVSNMSAIDETTNDEQDEDYIDLVDPSNNKSGGIMDLIMSAVMPGYNFIKGALNKPQSYQQFSPGTSIRNGIVSIDGVNTPYRNFGGDFYDTNTGLNRFDRARNRFNKTGSTFDLFGSSRTGKEFFENRRRIKEQKRLATDRNRRLEKNIQTRMMDGESLSDIGKSTFTGPGMAFEQQSGGVTGKGTANERNYGGR